MKRGLPIVILAALAYCLLAGVGFGQTLPSRGLVGSNSTDVLLFVGDDIWFGTGGGVSVLRNGTTPARYTAADGIGKGNCSALAYGNGILWAATAFDSTLSDGNTEDVGGGLSFSTDQGHTWTHLPQPVDAPDDSLNEKKPTTVAISNIAFDIAVHHGTVWIASFAGGIRKSEDNGQTWAVAPPDGNQFSALTYLNHRVFAVISAENGLWCGTAGGVNRSTDDGQTWTNFNHATSGISGNFITALAEQQVDGRSYIWAASWQAEGETEFTAVSFSKNNGLTWQTTLPGEQVHNFAFDDNDVYAVSDNGLFKSSDFGRTWYRFPPVVSEDGSILTQEYSSAGVHNGVLWLATQDGIASSGDGGSTWVVSRTFEQTGAGGGISTYAYPNPFSPLRHNQIGGDGHVRIQYNTQASVSVTLRIFDFSMRKVRTIVNDETRSANRDHTELWNGLDDTGRMVDNGVYFYRLDLSPGEAYWGKIVVLN